MVKVFGHGSESPGDELNSRASFHRLANAGVDGVELDVRRTADDVVIARHDAFLPDGRVVNATPFDEFPDDTVTLTEALDICRGLLVNVEIKNFSIDPGFDADERVTEVVLRTLASRTGDRVIVSSFGPECLRRVRARRPDIPTAVLLFHPEDPDVVLSRVVADGHPLVHPFEPHVDEYFVAAAHRWGLRVNVWTMDERPATMRRLVELGVDGVITGRPDLVPRR